MVKSQKMCHERKKKREMATNGMNETSDGYEKLFEIQ
jgi:hypothetical protein